MKLAHYVGREQRYAVRQASQGEEREYFSAMMDDLSKRVDTMPTTYKQDGLGDSAIAYLHYFTAGSDWWITEKDSGGPDDEDPGRQDQAFGLACLNGDWQNAEVGYISIADLIAHGTELDLYWTPKTLGTIKAKALARV